MESPFRLALILSLFAASGLAAPFDQAPFDVPANRIALTMAPSPDNPRNSEGAFATLRSGRIIFCYTA